MTSSHLSRNEPTPGPWEVAPTDGDIREVLDSCREQDWWQAASEDERAVAFARAVLSMKAVAL